MTNIYSDTLTDADIETAKRWAAEAQTWPDALLYHPAKVAANVILGLLRSNASLNKGNGVLFDTLNAALSTSRQLHSDFKKEIARKEAVIRKRGDKIRALSSQLEDVEAERSAAQVRYIDAETDRRKLATKVANQGHEIADLKTEILRLKKALPKKTRHIVEFCTRNSINTELLMWKIFRECATAQEALDVFNKCNTEFGWCNNYRVVVVNEDASVEIARSSN